MNHITYLSLMNQVTYLLRIFHTGHHQRILSHSPYTVLKFKPLSISRSSLQSRIYIFGVLYFFRIFSKCYSCVDSIPLRQKLKKHSFSLRVHLEPRLAHPRTTLLPSVTKVLEWPTIVA